MVKSMSYIETVRVEREHYYIHDQIQIAKPCTQVYK